MQMRRFIILAGVVLLVFMALGIATGAVIAKSGPFLPGNPFFPIQNISEQIQARLQTPAENRVEAYLMLLERRIENLIAQTGTTYESVSLAYLNAAVDQAVQAWSQGRGRNAGAAGIFAQSFRDSNKPINRGSHPKSRTGSRLPGKIIHCTGSGRSLRNGSNPPG